VQKLRKIKKWLIKNIADIRLYKGGIILFGDSHYRMKGPDVRDIINALQPGDVLLRRYDHYLGSHLTPGYYSHAAIYVGQDEVAHMLADGICKEDILTFCRTDAVAVLRCMSPGMAEAAVIEANYWLAKGVDYDYEFEAEDEEFYCTEFVWVCFQEDNRIEYDKYILPDDFLESKIFKMVLRRPNVNSS
jgi:hypothetical protein